MQISVVIPAYNEEKTIENVVRVAGRCSKVCEVIVVNNGSTDDTARIAENAGAEVVNCPVKGLGNAMKAGVVAAKSSLILRSDADIDNWQEGWIELLSPKNDFRLIRGIYQSPYNQLPMSNYVVRPYLKLFRPQWADIPIPTTGTYLFDRNDFDWSHLPDNWAIDIAILLHALTQFPDQILNVPIGILSDRQRDVIHYTKMATDLTEFLIKYFEGDLLSRHSL
jgi:glucosyl-3-phosphoglycerate synthase